MEQLNLEEILLKEGIVSADQIQTLKLEQQRSAISLIKAIRQLKFISEDILLDFLSKKMNLKKFSLRDFSPKKEVFSLLPLEFLNKEKVIPLFIEANTLSIGLLDPLDVHLLQDLSFRTGLFIKPYLIKEAELQQILDQYSENTKSEAKETRTSEDKIREEGSMPTVIEAVNLLLLQASKVNASDIHIEPLDEGKMELRLRIDGVLKEISPPQQGIYDAFISRIKIMANLDIAERRQSQDGRFSFDLAQYALDVRVSVIPTIKGESIVLRLLKQDKKLLTLPELGMSKTNLEKYANLINHPQGIILVTGPTGSGKTTTLYASLLALKTTEKNIITIEDPVEYKLDFCRQIQVNPKVNLVFATGLRSILRHDPDIIMVGEIRDLETAAISIQAALTGHLVFATLHTNDAATTITRLIDMGIEPFLISSCLNGVVAQRLVRVLCPKCKKPIQDISSYSKILGSVQEAGSKIDYPVYEAVGCQDCLNTGFSGRMGIFEVMELNSQIGRLCVEKKSADEIANFCRQQGMKFMLDDGWQKVKDGLTSPQELMRVLGTEQ